jgi:hypothetical protein
MQIMLVMLCEFTTGSRFRIRNNKLFYLALGNMFWDFYPESKFFSIPDQGAKQYWIPDPQHWVQTHRFSADCDLSTLSRQERDIPERTFTAEALPGPWGTTHQVGIQVSIPWFERRRCPGGRQQQQRRPQAPPSSGRQTSLQQPL